jgi:IS30 family transposase
MGPLSEWYAAFLLGEPEKIELKHGYSQSEVARHLGVHYSAISNLLRKNQINRSKTCLLPSARCLVHLIQTPRNGRGKNWERGIHRDRRLIAISQVHTVRMGDEEVVCS